MAEKAANLQEAFEMMAARFNPNAAKGVNAIFQFELSGDDGGKYWIKIADQQMEAHEGEHESPTLTIIATAENYLKLVNGEIAPMTAFMQGKLRVKGNMGEAMKLQSIFGL
ncbi:MAG: sterol-binding protein [Phototrophicales bacterium]|nr:MAG: sterol-binding protein [Phototrophicales bacterium]